MIEQYLIKKLSFEEIFEYLNLCDRNFNPPLSFKVDLNSYSKKISELAVHYCAIFNQKIIGLTCCYCNDPNKDIAFLSVTCIHPDYFRKGIGEKLTLYVESDLKTRNFRRIRAEIDIENVASQNLHKKLGYTIVETKGTSYYFEKIITD